MLCQICLVKQARAVCVCKCAGQPKVVDHLSNVISIEWAGSDALVYTQADALGRPSKVLRVHACNAFKPAPMRHTLVFTMYLDHINVRVSGWLLHMCVFWASYGCPRL